MIKKSTTSRASLSHTRLKGFSQGRPPTQKRARHTSHECENEVFTDDDDDDTSDEDDMLAEETLSDGDDTSSDAEESLLPSRRAECAQQQTETGTSLEEQFKDLALSLDLLESPQELKRTYAPQCSMKYSQTVNLSEAQILSEFTSMDNRPIDADTLMPAPDDQAEFWEFSLHNFYVYRSPTHPRKHRGKYESLHTVSCALADGHDDGHWLIDGFLEHNGLQKRVFGAAIVQVSIGGFENMEQHSVNDSIWVKTKESQGKNYWYRLKSASKEYSTFWNAFVWLADFTKYFIDYLYTRSELGVVVHLTDFRTKFWGWLDGLHGERIRDWHKLCEQRTDFCHDVSHYRRFLYDQANDLYPVEDTSADIPPVLQHPIWAEIGDPKGRQSSLPTEKTSVTPNVASSFSEFKAWEDFDLLEVVHLCHEVQEYRKKRAMEWKFPDKLIINPSEAFITVGTQQISRAAWILEEAATRNQTVRIHRPDAILHRVVIVRSNDTFRYAWVRRTERCNFSVVWLVLPSETLCGQSSYKIGNELFFVDSCNCDPIPYRDVVEIVDVCVKETPTNSSQLFVNLLYREDGEEFVDEVLSNLACRCTMSQNPRPTAPQASISNKRQSWPKMRVVSLFSGCGMFEGAFTYLSFIELVLAVEIWETAALSHRANHPDTRCEVDSVEYLLKTFASGQRLMPPVDFVMGGPPCRGYSLLNNHRGTKNAAKDCSLLANMLSWVDIFLPAYVLIENVPTMDPSDPAQQNACAQAISFLVSLGYQTRRSVYIDSNFGGASNRKRLFIVAAAPGAKLPRKLVPTHGPEGSGLKESQCVRHTIGNLEPVYNDTLINVAKPAHIPLERLSIDWRVGVNHHAILQRIPEGMSLSKSYYAGLLLRPERQFFKTLNPYQQDPNSKCLKRIDPDRPSRTIATLITPMDAKFGGEIIHPFQNRCVTLEETRRFQGVPSWFILVGDIKDQYKQLGNLVPWALGTALGRSFKESWLMTMAKRRATMVSSVSYSQNPSYSATVSGQLRLLGPSNSELKMVVRGNMRREIIEISSDEDDDFGVSEIPRSNMTNNSTPQLIVKEVTQCRTGVEVQSAVIPRAKATYSKRKAPMVCSDDSDSDGDGDVETEPIKKAKN